MIDYYKISRSHPSLARGRVWCTQCGSHADVSSMACLRVGWPKCCGLTMTIDSPEERAKLRAVAQ